MLNSGVGIKTTKLPAVARRMYGGRHSESLIPARRAGQREQKNIFFLVKAQLENSQWPYRNEFDPDLLKLTLN